MTKSYGIEVKWRDFSVESKAFETEDQLSKYIADLNWASVDFVKVARIRRQVGAVGNNVSA